MITIRKALPSDASPISEFMFLAMEEITYYLIGKESKSEGLAFLSHFISKKNNQYSYENCFVAEENGQIQGHINLYQGHELIRLRQPVLDYLSNNYGFNKNLENETQAGERYIDTLAVLPTAQGKGIGKQLIAYAIQQFVTENKETLGLLVEQSNPNAKRLYLKMGFEVVEETMIFNKTMEHLQLSHKKKSL